MAEFDIDVFGVEGVLAHDSRKRMTMRRWEKEVTKPSRRWGVAVQFE